MSARRRRLRRREQLRTYATEERVLKPVARCGTAAVVGCIGTGVPRTSPICSNVYRRVARRELPTSNPRNGGRKRRLRPLFVIAEAQTLPRTIGDRCCTVLRVEAPEGRFAAVGVGCCQSLKDSIRSSSFPGQAAKNKKNKRIPAGLAS